MWGDIAIAYVLAFITTFFITPYTIKLAKRLGAVDTPKDSRRVNKITMPRLGRTCYYCWIYNIYYLFVNCFKRRKKY